MGKENYKSKTTPLNSKGTAPLFVRGTALGDYHFDGPAGRPKNNRPADVRLPTALMLETFLCLFCVLGAAAQRYSR
jgi:hypothetical protein